MERSTCPKQNMYGMQCSSGCRRTWDNLNALALRYHRTALRFLRHCMWGRRGQGCAQELAVGSPCNRLHEVHFSARTMGLKGLLHLLPIRWLVNCLDGNKWKKLWNKRIKSYWTVIFCNNWTFWEPFITHLLLYKTMYRSTSTSLFLSNKWRSRLFFGNI